MDYVKIAKSIKKEQRELDEFRIAKEIEELEKDPNFKSARGNFRSAQFDKARADIFNSDVSVAETRLKEAETEYFKQLAKYGKTESDLKHTPHCTLCNDQGVIDGRLCDCVIPDIKRIAEESCDIQVFGKTFDDFDLEKYQGQDKINAEKVFTFVKKWGENFPNITKNLITISGKTGVGKTYLLSILATYLIKEGFNVAFFNAFSLNKLFLKAHTSYIKDQFSILSEIYDADVLFIDDLGVEQIYKNVTCEYLYNLFTERQKKATFITTNLSPDMLLDRYDERIFSRLRGAVMLELTGKDLRR